ncbi:MAG: MFS transporter [archaeon]
MKAEQIKADSILFLNTLGYSLTTALLSVYLSGRGISLANIGVIFSVGIIIAGLFRVPIGILVDCMGRKKFMILGSIGYPLFAVGLIFANKVPHFTFLNIFVELFGAVFWTAFSAHFFDIMSSGKEGAALGVRNLVVYSASIAAPLLAGVIATNFGFTSVFAIGAAISASAILIALGVKDHNHKKQLCYNVMHTEYSEIFKIKGLPLIAAIIFVGDFIFVFWSIFMPIWLLQAGVSLEAIGFILTTNLIVGALLQIPLGKAIDKLPVRYILIPGFLLFWLGGILFFAFRNYTSYIFGRILVGSGSDASYWPAVGMLAKLTPRVNNGGVVALIFGLSVALKGAGVLIGGVLTERFGIQNVLVAVSFIALGTAIAILPFAILKKKGTQFHKVYHHAAHMLRRH